MRLSSGSQNQLGYLRAIDGRYFHFRLSEKIRIKIHKNNKNIP